MNDFEELSKLTPTNPGNLVPGWEAAKPRMLNQILARAEKGNPRVPWRMVSAAAAAVLALVATIAIWQQLPRPNPVAIPPGTTSKTPNPSDSETVSTKGQAQLVMAQGAIYGDAKSVSICFGAVSASFPSKCGGTLIPIIGFTPAQIAKKLAYPDQAEASWEGLGTVVGYFETGQLQAVRVYGAEDPSAPVIPGKPNNYYDFGPLCDTPTQGQAAPNPENAAPDAAAAALTKVAASLPGYQGIWRSTNSGYYNIALTEGVAEARAKLAKVLAEKFCVGTIPGPTNAELLKAQSAVIPALGGQAAMVGVGVARTGTFLELDVLIDDQGIRSKLETAVGTAIMPYTKLSPFFHPVPQGWVAKNLSATNSSTSSQSSSHSLPSPEPGYQSDAPNASSSAAPKTR